MGGGDPPNLGLAFKRLAASRNKRKLSQDQQYFVKKLHNIPLVALPVDQTCQTALNIADRGLIANSLVFGIPLRLLQGGFKGTGNLSFQKTFAAT